MTEAVTIRHATGDRPRGAAQAGRARRRPRSQRPALAAFAGDELIAVVGVDGRHLLRWLALGHRLGGQGMPA